MAAYRYIQENSNQCRNVDSKHISERSMKELTPTELE